MYSSQLLHTNFLSVNEAAMKKNQGGKGGGGNERTRYFLTFSAFALTASFSTCCQNFMSVKIGCLLILALRNSLKYPASASAPSHPPPLLTPVADSAVTNACRGS